MRNILILYVKSPLSMPVKTRMGVNLEFGVASSIYSAIVDHMVRLFNGSDRWDFEIHYENIGGESEMVQWLGEKFVYVKQKGNDLGEKMEFSIKNSFQRKYQRSIIIGSDIPEISKADINEAFEKLNDSQVVLGPSFDGGYWLVGMNNTVENSIFFDVPWSSSMVFESTKKILLKKKLSFDLIRSLNDLDSKEDLENFLDNSSKIENSDTKNLVNKIKSILISRIYKGENYGQL